MVGKTRKTKSEGIKKELLNLNKLYTTRRAALDKMSKAILEDLKISEKNEEISKNQ